MINRGVDDAPHSRLPKTFVYVTHDQEEAMTLADRRLSNRGYLIRREQQRDG